MSMGMRAFSHAQRFVRMSILTGVDLIVMMDGKLMDANALRAGGFAGKPAFVD
jgi:hypothetical protein